MLTVCQIGQAAPAADEILDKMPNLTPEARAMVLAAMALHPYICYLHLFTPSLAHLMHHNIIL